LALLLLLLLLLAKVPADVNKQTNKLCVERNFDPLIEFCQQFVNFDGNNSCKTHRRQGR
jgi:hypothetical protein